jgi:hypothetical protein
VWPAQRTPTAVNLGFLDRSRYFSVQVAPQLSSQGWVNSVTVPLLLTKSGSAGNRTRDLCICSQKLWPLDHRGCLSNKIRNNSREITTLIVSSQWAGFRTLRSIWAPFKIGDHRNDSEKVKSAQLLLFLTPKYQISVTFDQCLKYMKHSDFHDFQIMH